MTSPLQSDDVSDIATGAPHQALSASTKTRLMIVDDDTSHLASLVKIFKKMKLDVVGVPRGREALKLIEEQVYTVVLCDLMLPDIDGLEVLTQLKRRQPQLEVVMMTAYGTIERAVEAMRVGAYDFITKPFRRAEIERVIKRALERVNLIEENRALKQQLAEARIAARNALSGEGLIGHAPAFRNVIEVASQAAPSQVTILLQGESGTGKEVVARAIHAQSSRRDGPFVAVNCGALPEGIIEAELFGVERGAFTGANQRREGRWGRAHGGTLFLDEIGEMPIHLQVKLLRALQSGEYERVGGTETLHADCRVIAATHVNLLEAVREGDFREDLYYRLKVIALTLPPLRERVDDIPLLAEHFFQRFVARHQRALSGMSIEARRAMVSYPWPGNVRELENCLERAVVLCRDELIKLEDLPLEVRSTLDQRDRDDEGELSSGDARLFVVPLGTPLQEIERRLILKTLDLTGGDKRQTAQMLGVATRTIYRKLASFEDDSPEEVGHSEDL